MKAWKILFSLVENSWKLGSLLIIFAGFFLAIHEWWLPEVEIFGGGINWAESGLIAGGLIVIASSITRLARRVHRDFNSKRASRIQSEAASQDFETVRQNIRALTREERLLLMDALKRYPYHIEVLEFGPSRSLIKKEILCPVGETSHGTVACKLHPWLAQYRDDLIPIAAEE